ncbi:Putative phage tail protein [Rhizobium sp. RU33A]|uniref:baseplate multidomain protein megatron n=1 Tax=Rhizobium sp. RU33A TaxID=1907413 RepID=UPI0009545244|nr:glycoside hydrolase TIM-barrel-like domain-containing protein [Rhizobium sp. RU33A]SIQ49012.1 Putative phage tail protein [Rhizobium sp. RU33A]
MATILLQAAGAALGSVFGPVGAAIGQAAGALAGSMIDRSLLSGTREVNGARLSSARISGASEGTVIPRLYGTARLGGTLIWATRFEEETVTERTGGKSSGGTRTTTYRYYANLALGLCEGPIAGVRRVWADGRELDTTEIEMRVYRGTESQPADPLIAAKQGADNAPAYRGLAYVVFERLPLDDFGNRIPLIQFEVIRPVGALEEKIRAVTMIPGATEHGYATVRISDAPSEGAKRWLNRNTLVGATDWQASLDELQALCPDLESVALVVAWFGTDLRAGDCRVLPGVEVGYRNEESRPWSVAGLARGDAYVVSRHSGGPAYGGSPSDESVIEAIRDIKARGLKVTLYPFVLMDIPSGNGLPDPYGGAEQAAYPWRGRITAYPPGSDKTASARAQVSSFVYRGDGYRRLVLHYAALAAAAGGVDAFLLGSELRGLTALRDAANAFPFVEALVALAGEVRGLLGGGTAISYGADWTEYFGHQPADGSGDVFFHLDPLWASPHVTAVGIDNYMPLADWRDEDLEAESPDGFTGADDAEGFARTLTSGEGFDWFYASEADRRARVRTPITDGAYGKPWVFRFKDLKSWWENPHFNRIGGVEQASPTAWVPRMKPFWMTEVGCGAVDKGSNQPNIFVDAKSAESGRPYFSAGARSDSQQRRFLEAHLDHWAGSLLPPDMVDPSHVYAWTWDARPYPAFPQNTALWADGSNWRTGHWLNGRLGTATLADTIAAILRDHGFSDFDVSEVAGDLGGYVKGDLTSARDLIEPLLDLFQIDVIEDAGRLKFRTRPTASLAAREIMVLADIADRPLWSETRGHDSDFASEALVTFYDPAAEYVEASVRSRKVEAATDRQLARDLPAAMPEETALAAAEGWLRDNRLARRTVQLALGPQEIAVEPGDVLRFPEGPDGRFLVQGIEEGFERRLTLRAFAGKVSAPVPVVEPGRVVDGGGAAGFAPVVQFLDLPRLEGASHAGDASVSAYGRPWRRLAVSSSPEVEGYRLRLTLDRPATLGRLVEPLAPGPVGRFDWANALVVEVLAGAFASASRMAVLSGANRLAVRANTGGWEVIGFVEAEEVAVGRFRLTGLLRGLGGTEDAVVAGAAAGAEVVVLDEAVRSLGLGNAERGAAQNWILEPMGLVTELSGPHVFAGGLRAETPLSPVHAKVLRQAAGDLAITWIRRSRIEADAWTDGEVPLDEAQECYRLEILDGGMVLRVVEVTEPAWTYAVADELTDFGAPQTALGLRIRQLGRLAAGLPLEAVVPVD